jgi:hypothetical protein
MTNMRIEGADQLGDLAKRLKQAGDKELRKELLRGIQKAGKPLKAAAKEAALDGLPSSGGLNAYVAAGQFAVRTRSGGRNPGIRLVGKKKGHDIRATDKGRLRHPVWGHDWWVTQDIKPGWWTDTMTSDHVLAPVRRDVLDAMQAVAAKIARG